MFNYSLSWRPKFLATVFLGDLLYDLIAFMIKVMTTNVYWAPTMCQALSKCFIWINSTLATMQWDRSVIISTLHIRKLRHGKLYFAAQLLKLRKQATGLRVQTQGYSLVTPLTMESLVDLIRKNKPTNKQKTNSYLWCLFWGKCTLSPKANLSLNFCVDAPLSSLGGLLVMRWEVGLLVLSWGWAVL